MSKVPTENEADVVHAILSIYARRVDNANTGDLMQIKSFGLAIGGRLLEGSFTDGPAAELELAMCALERRAHGLVDEPEYLAALVKYAPHLEAWRRCPVCQTWGAPRTHLLSCSILKAEDQRT